MGKSYTEEKKVQRRQSRHKKIARNSFLFLIILLGLVYLLLFSGFFELKSVVVKSAGLIEPAEVESFVRQYYNQKVFGVSRAKNIFIFSTNGLKSPLEKIFPRINQIEMKYDSLHDISISITERKAIGIWCLIKKSACYFYDEENVAFSEAPSSSGHIFTTVNDHTDRSITIGQNIGEDEWLKIVSEIKKILQFGGISVKSFEFGAENQFDFTVITSEGWSILYTKNEQNKKQTNILLAFLKEKMTPAIRANLEYVDLRIADRIYYKTR